VSDSASPVPVEVLACHQAPGYFLDRYVLIYDSAAADWLPFRLWTDQLRTLDTIRDNRLVVILKARQLGLTWLVLGFALWELLFRPAATVLLFSRRDDEAVDLLKTRLRGMYDRLPDWLKVRSFLVDNDHEWQLSNGSRALAFPTTAGDSYSATLAVVDEADLVPDLDRLMRSVKPTIERGRMILLSRADKSRPQSPFKRVYTAARQGKNEWAPVFLPWNARPDRDTAWYESQRQDILARTGSVDDLYEQYPATDTEAISPRSLDKRIRAEWLEQCYVERQPVEVAGPAPIHGLPAIPGLVVYSLPRHGGMYVVGADPAEGNPTSDDSALTVLHCHTGEEVASLAGKFEPGVFASYAHQVAVFFNRAAILCERNNHGHAVLLWLTEHGEGVPLLCGHDNREGWMSSTVGKTLMYDRCADAFKNKEVTLHSFGTFTQLASIDGNTLRAPDGLPDDCADSFSLAVCGRPHALERANHCGLFGDIQSWHDRIDPELRVIY
jgi:hypothetical protein